jgi:hypothetical protein
MARKSTNFGQPNVPIVTRADRLYDRVIQATTTRIRHVQLAQAGLEQEGNMSLLQRFSAVQPRWHREPQGSALAFEPEAPLALRFAFPRGPFASLRTDPLAAADDAYLAFTHHELTPGIAEHEVAVTLQDADVVCAPIETSANYIFDLERERSPAARRRLFVRYLVQQQFIHEANMRTLYTLRRSGGARRVTVLSGCCAVCDAIANRPHRLSHPPTLPTPGCQRHGGCICGYVPVVE